MRDSNLLNYRLILFINNHKQVHYGDIESHFDISRRTILKHLDTIEKTARESGVKLVRKQNVGIYFEGNVDELVNKFNKNKGNRELPSNRQERIHYLITKLLMSDHPFTIQSMAEELYISRTTIESDLQRVKEYLEKEDIQIHSNQQGIYLRIDEKDRRKNISKLLQNFWGQSTYVEKNGKKLSRHIQLTGDFYQLFDEDEISRVIKCVNTFEDNSKLILTDYEFESLIIHLIIAQKRINNNQVLNNDYNPDLVLENDTLSLIKILEDEFQFKIPILERQYLNIHVLAIEGKSIDKKKSENKFNSFIKNELSKNFSYDSELVSGLILHLQPALNRSNFGLSIRNPYTQQIKKVYPEAFEQAMQLCLAIRDKYSVKLNEDETAYVALHIQSFIERRNAKGKLKAAVVCSTGMGTSRFLEQQIKRKYAGSIDVASVMSVSEFVQNEPDVDIIISTIPIKDSDIPVILVSPFISEQDSNRIDANINLIHKENIQNGEFLKLLDPDLIQFVDKPIKQDQALKMVIDSLQKNQFVIEGALQSAIKREEISTTSFKYIATPHCDPKYVTESKIAVLIAPKGIDWGNTKVKVVYFIALNKTIKNKLTAIYSYFNEIVHDEDIVKGLLSSETSNDVINVLGGESIARNKSY